MSEFIARVHNHFTSHINLRELILNNRPKTLVECGAGSGECTRKIQELLNVYPFEYTVISDAMVLGVRPEVKFVEGISFLALEEFADSSIDFCIIDTDHNYWTLARELSVLDRKLSDGGMVAMHDIEFCYHDTGIAGSYGTAYEYPEKEILEMGLSRGGLGDCLMDFLSSKRFDYKLIRFTLESQGAAVIQKKNLEAVNVYRPGTKSPYLGSNQAKEYEKAC